MTNKRKQRTQPTIQLTYDDRNYATIPQEEWLYIAEAVAKVVSGDNLTGLHYEPDLRPYDAALLAVEDANYFVSDKYKALNWVEWKALLKF